MRQIFQNEELIAKLPTTSAAECGRDETIDFFAHDASTGSDAIAWSRFSLFSDERPPSPPATTLSGDDASLIEHPQDLFRTDDR